MPFKKKKFRSTIEARLEDLASQTEELRQQVVDRAPAVRDQLVDLLPDKDQLRDLRDDLFERLPDSVAEKVPDKVKPKKKSKLKRVAVLGVLTGAGAAAFAAMKGRSNTPPPPAPFPTAPTPPTPPTPTAEATGPAKKAAPAKEA
jgi:flagellar basal body-associated protein FliL